MSKKYAFTANSFNKLVTHDQWRVITRSFNQKEIDLNHVLKSAVWNPTTNQVEYTGPEATVGQILAFDMVPNEKKPGEMRRNYKFLPNLNVVDAGTLIDYLLHAPNKGSNNGTITTEPMKLTGGFGGAAS